ncbi:MAG: ATP-dependent helicase [Actinobacteria bacterium]|nr:MAG: ATP-dependent helicase [Actinomycetota bacterium]
MAAVGKRVGELVPLTRVAPGRIYTAEHVFESLNPEQLEAVTHRGAPLLVVAGAGSGKTLTLAGRVAHLLCGGAPPERILLLTFSRRAAREMLGRAERLTGRDVLGKVWGGTFHSMSNRLLRRYGGALGIRPDFTVLDQADAADLMDLIRGEMGLGRGERRFPRKDTLASIYSRTVNAGERLRAVVDRSFPWCVPELDGIRSVFAAYTDRKRSQNVLDYDDLLLFWNALMADPRAGPRVAGSFDHVLVDEYQDTNALQASILAGLGSGSSEVMVVGDDAQAIYSFRSATVENILRFPEAFPGTRVVTLERNYRSTRPILEASNAVIARAPRRHAKTLWSDREGRRRPVLVTCLDEAAQSDEVCRSLLTHREEGILLREQAVLFRAAHHSDTLEVELARRNIPFVKFGGLRFLEAAHVKDVLALLRILENPHDEVSWFRILQLIEGVGPAGARELIARLGVREAVGPSPLRRLQADPPEVPVAARPGMDRLRDALAACLDVNGSAPLPVPTQIERLRGFLEPEIRGRYRGAASRLRDLEQLEGLASGSASRGAFLADITLDPPASTGDLAGPPLLDEDYVILSTIHSAKGCEWDAVHVIHAADGMIPSDLATGTPEEIEEERRLLYVAMTRARDSLTVYFPLRYYRRPRGLEDPHSFAQLTRFISPEVRELFDERRAHLDELDAGTAEGLGPVPVGSARGVDAFLAGLWRD